MDVRGQDERAALRPCRNSVRGLHVHFRWDTHQNTHTRYIKAVVFMPHHADTHRCHAHIVLHHTYYDVQDSDYFGILPAHLSWVLVWMSSGEWVWLGVLVCVSVCVCVLLAWCTCLGVCVCLCLSGWVYMCMHLCVSMSVCACMLSLFSQLDFSQCVGVKRTGREWNDRDTHTFSPHTNTHIHAQHLELSGTVTLTGIY